MQDPHEHDEGHLQTSTLSSTSSSSSSSLIAFARLLRCHLPSSAASPLHTHHPSCTCSSTLPISHRSILHLHTHPLCFSFPLQAHLLIRVHSSPLWNFSSSCSQLLLFMSRHTSSTCLSSSIYIPSSSLRIHISITAIIHTD